ncbi:hypothetical protein BDZ97DRAFT_1928229 [Flammula alnicola]|nr:hypothetical protein BDZ97DRAFT_1928229 [Flammula alnicola]
MSQPASTDRSRKSQSSILPPSLPKQQALLNTLLESKPHIYVKDPEHTASKGTRPPKFYDLHLHESLQLKKIVLSEDLLPTLSTLCDQHMTLNQGRVLRRNSGRNRLQVLLRRAMNPKNRPPIKNEQCITDDFLRRTGNPCHLVASTLLFELDDWDNVLEWEPTSMRNAHGLADGHLFIPNVIVPTLTEEQQADIKAIKGHLLDTLTVWEFKSLQAADLKVMEGIVRLTTRELTWMTCGSVHGSTGLRLTCGNSSDSLFCDKHLTNHIWSVTGRKTGPDAQQLWWSTSDGLSHIGEKRKQADSEYSAPSVSGTSSVTDFSLLSCHSSVETESIAESVGPSSEHQEHILEEDSEPTDPGVQNYQTVHVRLAAALSDLIKPDFITQQVWVELVRVDATFIVINAGNYEIIGRRHRESQTLYISPVIHVSMQSNPTHYKIHAGLGIAAYHDTRDRARQLKQMLLKPEGDWLLTYKTSYDYDSLKYPNRVKGKEDSNNEREAEGADSARVLRKQQLINSNEELIDQLRSASHLAVLLPHYILSGDIAHSFRRKVPPSSYPIQPLVGGSSDVKLEEKLATGIQLQIGNLEHLSGAAYRASLTRINGPIKTVHSRGLVLKLARNKSRKERLQKEYGVYSQLWEEELPSLVPVYGLFAHEDPAIGFEVLLMGDGGVPLSKLVADKKFEIVKRQYWDIIKRSLSSSIHGGNYLHNGLDLEHVLFNKKKDKVTFISLADLESLQDEEQDRHAIERRQERDMNALRFVLSDRL